MAKQASKQGSPKIGYFIQSRGPGDRVEFEEVYVYGPTYRRDEGIVGRDLRMRPTRLGVGDYTFVGSPEDVKWARPGESQPSKKSHAQIKREVDEILAGRHGETSGGASLPRRLRFRVDAEKQPSRVFNSAEEALSYGTRHVYLQPSKKTKMLELLERAEPVVWSYGFAFVEIVPFWSHFAG